MVDQVRFLRRGASTDTAVNGDEHTATTVPAAAARPGHTAGKGRPTPKRRDSQLRSRGPVPPPPKTQRESMRLAKQNRKARAERRKDAAERRGRMMAGDESALMAKDRGPVKRFLRDFVDSRRHLLGLFMPLAFLVLLSLTLPIPQVQHYFQLFTMAAVTAMVLEGVLLGRQATKLVRERFPKERIGAFGVGWYTFARSSQLRRLRIPKPQVNIGDQV